MAQKTANVSEWTLRELKFLKEDEDHKSIDSVIRMLIGYYEKDQEKGRIGGSRPR